MKYRTIMVFAISCRPRSLCIKASYISDKDQVRIKSLKANCKQMEGKLEKNITLALNKCNPNKSIKEPDNAQCAVLWDEIEELSNTIHDMKNEIHCLEDDNYDCSQQSQSQSLALQVHSLNINTNNVRYQ